MITCLTAGTPHPALRDVVLRYEGFSDGSGVPVTFHELPCTFVPIIIDLGAGWSVTHQSAPATRLDSFVAGVTEHSVLVGHQGVARCLQIDLTPLGARRLLGVPMSDLANATVPIDAVLGRYGARLVARIADAPDWSSRFALLDAALRARLADAVDDDREVAWSLSRIAQSGGTVAIGDLAVELGWSHRKLIARFRDAVGLPPKLIARITRFEALADALRDDPAVDWADTAVRCGFSDQAHLAREVRDLAGMTPTGLRAELVNFVQDDALGST